MVTDQSALDPLLYCRFRAPKACSSEVKDPKVFFSDWLVAAQWWLILTPEPHNNYAVGLSFHTRRKSGSLLWRVHLAGQFVTSCRNAWAQVFTVWVHQKEVFEVWLLWTRVYWCTGVTYIRVHLEGSVPTPGSVVAASVTWDVLWCIFLAGQQGGLQCLVHYHRLGIRGRDGNYHWQHRVDIMCSWKEVSLLWGISSAEGF